eukprot:12894941-Prorocentrum_lima.AAC.1
MSQSTVADPPASARSSPADAFGSAGKVPHNILPPLNLQGNAQSAKDQSSSAAFGADVESPDAFSSTL